VLQAKGAAAAIRHEFTTQIRHDDGGTAFREAERTAAAGYVN
jgi:hypothetical protein